MANIYTVSELTAQVKRSLEQDFPGLWVKGQVSNLARPSSGHVYFTLKDADSALSVVWFRGSQARAEGVDPVTGEVFAGAAGAASLADGKEVLCRGRLSVYAQRGVYQLIAESVQDVGLGRLHLEFEALKKRYLAKGYFDSERKRRVPRNPRRIALVAAPGSAAIRDFLRLTAERGLGGEIRVFASLVQGEDAPAQIARALDLANEDRAGESDWAQVVVLIRGGGSLEDLWAFNTEPVAEAVYRSRVPVVCGVGHEVDVSIADMVADLRAATPSHAAQLLFEERETLAQGVDGLELALTREWTRRLQQAETRLQQLQRALHYLSPLGRVRRSSERLADLAGRLHKSWTWSLRNRHAALAELESRLVRAVAPQTFERRQQGLAALEARLQQAGERLLDRREAGLDRLALKLEALDPQRPLRRGYGLVRSRETGRLVRGVADVRPGQKLDIRVSDGEIGAVVAHDDKSVAKEPGAAQGDEPGSVQGS